MWVEGVAAGSKGRGLCSASTTLRASCFCLRRRQKNIADAIARAPAIPPIVPPAIAPTFFLDDEVPRGLAWMATFGMLVEMSE